MKDVLFCVYVIDNADPLREDIPLVLCIPAFDYINLKPLLFVKLTLDPKTVTND